MADSAEGARLRLLTRLREKTDAGRLLSSLRVPLLSLHATSPRDENPAQTRSEVFDRFRNNHANGLVTGSFIEESFHTIWEHQPEAFDRALRALVEQRLTGGPGSISTLGSRTGARPPGGVWPGVV